MLFYFVRHGQTEANLLEILAGSGQDHPLNEAGLRQARVLAEQLPRLLSSPPRRLLSSAMTRARQTAEPLAQVLGLPVETHVDWREWHLGEWEGQSYHSFMAQILGNGEPREGESRKAFYQRVTRVWQAHHSDQQSYLVVSHGGVWLALQDFLQIPRFKINNCALVQVEANDGLWKAEVLWSGE